MTPPDWLDRSLYPFPSRVYDTGAGRMHYVDVGDGPTVLLVHGTPTWSFLYRRIINQLKGEYRVVAPDLLGFGLSDKPVSEAVAPERQAEYLRGLVDHLGLDRFVLGVHDFGGPIGLSVALDRPDQIDAVVLSLTRGCGPEATPRPSGPAASAGRGSGAGRTRAGISPRT